MKRYGIGIVALTLVAGMVSPTGAVETRERGKEPEKVLLLRLPSWLGDHVVLPVGRPVPLNGTAERGNPT